jgi:hypothetical protein
MLDLERAYYMAALDLAKAALTRIANENTLTLESVRVLAQLGMDAADRWKAKADAERAQIGGEKEMT